MNEEQTVITGRYSKYWDNSAKRQSSGKKMPDNIILDNQGEQVQIAVWGETFGQAPKIPESLANAKEGNLISVSTIKRVKDGIIQYNYDWKGGVKVIQAQEQAQSFKPASEVRQSEDKDAYWDKRNQHIIRESVLKTAVEVLALAKAENDVTATQALEHTLAIAEQLEKWVNR